jgi:hypothetical protein
VVKESRRTLNVKEFFMNKKLVFSIILICLLVFVADFAWAQNSPNVRWEYTITVIGPQDSVNAIVSTFDRLGAQGWELTTTMAARAIFKRRLP